MVLLRRIFPLSTPKIKKIAQFFNKFFVQFSQKYTTSALHRVKALYFTALKYYSAKVKNPSQDPPIWRRFVVVWSYMRPSASCLPPYIWRIPVVVCHLIFQKIFVIILKKPFFISACPILRHINFVKSIANKIHIIKNSFLKSA